MPKAIRARLVAFLIHLTCSALIGTSTFAMVYWAWYPGGLFDLTGGKALITLLVSCDVVLGPSLTLIAFNIAKPRRELRRDIATIATVQLIALIYGAHTMYAARPIYLVYNQGQINVVTANMLPSEASSQLPADVPPPSLFGPKQVGAREPHNVRSRNSILFSAAQGGPDIYQMPKYYVPYTKVANDVASQALSVAAFARRNDLDANLLALQVPDCIKLGDVCGLLPVVFKHKYTIAIVNRTTHKLVITSWKESL